MSDKVVFKLNKRDIVGKRVRHLRQAGVTPAIVYGADHDSATVEADTLKLERLINQVGTTTPFMIDFDGKKQLAIIKKIDRNAVRGSLEHIDFQLISAKEKIEAEVPIVLVGQSDSEAERAGLVVMQVLDKIEIEALPADMVPQIEVSVANLKEVGDRVTLADLVLPKGIELADKEPDMGLAIVNVYDPVELEAAMEAAGGDATDVDEVESEHGAEDGDQEGEKSDGEGGDGEAKPKADGDKQPEPKPAEEK